MFVPSYIRRLDTLRIKYIRNWFLTIGLILMLLLTCFPVLKEIENC